MDQIEMQAAVRILAAQTESIREKLVIKGVKPTERPALSAAGGCEMENLEVLERYQSTLIDQLAGNAAAASTVSTTPEPVTVATPATTKIESTESGLTSAEIANLQLTERVYYIKGKWSADQCRAAINARQAKKTSNPGPFAQILERKGLPADTKVCLYGTPESSLIGTNSKSKNSTK